MPLIFLLAGVAGKNLSRTLDLSGAHKIELNGRLAQIESIE